MAAYNNKLKRTNFDRRKKVTKPHRRNWTRIWLPCDRISSGHRYDCQHRCETGTRPETGPEKPSGGWPTYPTTATDTFLSSISNASLKRFTPLVLNKREENALGQATHRNRRPCTWPSAGGGDTPISPNDQQIGRYRKGIVRRQLSQVLFLFFDTRIRKLARDIRML